MESRTFAFLNIEQVRKWLGKVEFNLRSASLQNKNMVIWVFCQAIGDCVTSSPSSDHDKVEVRPPEIFEFLQEDAERRGYQQDKDC